MNDGEKEAYRDGLFVGAMSSLGLCIAIGFLFAYWQYRNEQTKQYFPGNDFPAEWVSTVVDENALKAFKSIEVVGEQSAFATQQFAFERWADQVKLPEAERERILKSVVPP